MHEISFFFFFAYGLLTSQQLSGGQHQDRVGLGGWPTISDMMVSSGVGLWSQREVCSASEPGLSSAEVRNF